MFLFSFFFYGIFLVSFLAFNSIRYFVFLSIHVINLIIFLLLRLDFRRVVFFGSCYALTITFERTVIIFYTSTTFSRRRSANPNVKIGLLFNACTPLLSLHSFIVCLFLSSSLILACHPLSLQINYTNIYTCPP